MALNAPVPLAELLAQDDAEHEELRQYVLPVEDWARLTPHPSDGYRWFLAPNVVCIERARRLRNRS